MRAEYYAFFDVDGTIIHETSMTSFLEYGFPHYYGRLSAYGKLRASLYSIKRKVFSTHKTREQLNTEYYQLYKGMDADRITALGYEWFKMIKNKNANLFNSTVLQEIKCHQENGAEIVMVSGAFLPCLQPIADYLNIAHILCVSPLIENSKYTGEIAQPQTIGAGKKQAIINFLKSKDKSTLARSYAYGDHISDLPMLELVGNPVVVSGDVDLEKHAINQAWKLI